MAAAHQRGNPSLFTKKVKEGKDIFILYPEALNVIWGGKGTNNRYWKSVKVEDGTSEKEALELVGVYWLEVSGKIPLSQLKKGTKYKMYFCIKMNQNASGWDNYDVNFNLRLTGQKSKQESERLSRIGNGSGWRNVPDKCLEFTVPDTLSNRNMALTFAMYEIECEDLKSGLVIREVRIEEV